jgi:beta-1,4-N-acetylglucosaminyltransferase
MKICIVSSAGGHLTEVRALRRAYEEYDHFYVINVPVDIPVDMRGKTYFITHSERDWKLLLNLWEAWQILNKERPSLILSTGAGCVVPFALIGKLFGVKSIFIEPITQVSRPSMTGRFMYHLADRLFYQWTPLARYFPRGIHGGPILWSS